MYVLIKKHISQIRRQVIFLINLNAFIPLQLMHTLVGGRTKQQTCTAVEVVALSSECQVDVSPAEGQHPEVEICDGGWGKEIEFPVR